MSGTFIATTRRGDFNATRYQGILVTDSYAQLASMLEKNLTPEHALFLAEPVHDSSGTTTDWYTRAEGTPTPLANLPEEEQNAARERIKSLASDINGLASSLTGDEKSSNSIRGNILALALRYPGTDHIYMVGAQPVLTCWGFLPGTVGAQPEDLMRLGAALPAAAAGGAATSATAPPAAVTVSRFPWWRALLSFLLGLLLLAALFLLAGLLFGPGGCSAPVTLPAGCSAGLPFGLTMPEWTVPGCSPASVPEMKEEEREHAPDPEKLSALTAEQEKEAALRLQLDDLRRQLEARAALCVQTPPKEEPKPEEPKEEPKEEQQPPSLAELMPTTPDPPKEEPKPVPPKEEKKPEKKPEPKPEKQKKGEDMRIPESAKKNKDVSFLEGCWDSDPGLVSMNTGEPIDVKYCFDANGRGTRTVTMTRSKDRCAGSVRAQFDALGNLIINADGAPCGRGGSFVPQDVQCNQPTGGGKATCYGQERGGKRNKWDAKFRRS